MSGPSTDGVVGHAMPNFHVGGCVMLSLRAILDEPTVLTLTTDGFRNPGIIKDFWDIARHYKMTSVIATPATASAIMAVRGATSDGHCIQSFNAGGSTVPLRLIRAFHEESGDRRAWRHAGVCRLQPRQGVLCPGHAGRSALGQHRGRWCG